MRLFLILLLQTAAFAQVRFELKEMLDHPLYWWPRTLLSYPVRFDEAKLKPDHLVLRRLEDGAYIPFQLSGVKTENGAIRFAFINFFSDLPTNGHRVYELSNGTPAAPVVAEPAIREHQDGDTITLETGSMKVRIPASRHVTGKAPGPIAQISRGGAWFGSSRITGKRRITDVTAARSENGPLFIEYKIKYRFEGGGTYTATVRAVSGYDFVPFYEEMDGLRKEDGLKLETTWSNFHPTHRQAPNHPYVTRQDHRGKHGFAQFDFERIDQAFVSTQHGVSGGQNPEGEMPFRLGIYEPWGAYVILNSANFWDERTSDAIGVFIDHTARWQDHDYSMWSASPTLQVRYYYADGKLTWRWPLVTGTRSTGIAVYDHAKDIAAVDRLEELSHPAKYTDGMTYPSEFFPASYTLFLQNRYGLLDLNDVKDWVLEYPEPRKRQPVIFKQGREKSPRDFEQTVMRSSLIRGLPVSGTRQNAGYNPVASRVIYGDWVDAFNRLYPDMTERQRRRLTAWMLMMAYVDAGDEMMPMRTMLSGHPNFLADIKNVPALAAFLFPEHPMAKEWSDEFGKFIELNARYHTRPEVKSWESSGGRWTENLGTYVWAALRPTSRTALALDKFVDGKNRLALPQLAELGDWMVNAVSAPFNGETDEIERMRDGLPERHQWGRVTPQNGPRRIHPPQGAHSARRMAPRTMWLFGNTLLNYKPLLAEYMMWASRPEDDDMEHFKEEVDPWMVLFPSKDNRGTNPHLQSSKYTGYGITLRAAVDTPEEVSLHLQQIDEGPNYRWGIAGEGGNGVIYYYAGGKSYSHNGREDVGDRAAHDTDFCSNFAVWKGGQFKSIGRNVLERPLYDLGAAQFAEILPRTGAGAYSWPEYVNRSVMLVGADYFVTYDHVYNDAVAHRFSWFTKEGDEMPQITMVKGGVRERQRLFTKIDTGSTHGVWYDGLGDAMAVITHKPGIAVQATPFGAQVKAGDATDYVFDNPAGVEHDANGVLFRGTAGIVRQRATGIWEIALFHGERAGAGGVEVAVDDADLGVSAVVVSTSEMSGRYFGRKGGTLRLKAGNGTFYVDGAPQQVQRSGGEVIVKLAAGEHRWQYTASAAIPNPPGIRYTENRQGGASIVVQPVASATAYKYEMSRDGGRSWAAAAQTITGLAENTKVHVRAIALNGSRESEPGPEYPVYVTSTSPHAPDGLKLTIAPNRVRAVWGDVLGASEYRLYRRVRGQTSYSLIYKGLGHEFSDSPQGVIAPFAMPGARENLLYSGPRYTIYEYAISAVNANGEGAKSAIVDTDPASWANWDPKPGEPFRRKVVHATSDNRDGMGSYYPK